MGEKVGNLLELLRLQWNVWVVHWYYVAQGHIKKALFRMCCSMHLDTCGATPMPAMFESDVWCCGQCPALGELHCLLCGGTTRSPGEGWHLDDCRSVLFGYPVEFEIPTER